MADFEIQGEDREAVEAAADQIVGSILRSCWTRGYNPVAELYAVAQAAAGIVDGLAQDPLGGAEFLKRAALVRREVARHGQPKTEAEVRPASRKMHKQIEALTVQLEEMGLREANPDQALPEDAPAWLGDLHEMIERCVPNDVELMIVQRKPGEELMVSTRGGREEVQRALLEGLVEEMLERWGLALAETEGEG